MIRSGFEKIYSILTWLIGLFYHNSSNNTIQNQPTESNFPASPNTQNSPLISNLQWSIKRVLDNEMLSDTEIFYALSILRNKFKHKQYLRGFQDPQTFNARFIKNRLRILVNDSDKFIQILHDGNAHWITVTNLGTTASRHVRIFDSLFNESTYVGNAMLVNFLKRIYGKKNINVQNEPGVSNELIILDNNAYDSVTCSIESVQIQSDTALCGLFAIAFAFDLCSEFRDPTTQFYNEEKMRKHLFKCLTEREFSEFPKLYESCDQMCQRSVCRQIEIYI